MLYTKSAYAPLDAVITEWSALSGNEKGKYSNVWPTFAVAA